MRDFSAPQLLGLIEYLVIGGLGLAGLALAWVIFAPTGSGARPVGSAMVDTSPAVFNALDPFFRLSNGDAGSLVVTPLNLTLYGIRADQASGRGSAIIGLPDGTQNSYLVGEQILPGAVLAGVTFDSVTISHNGAAEKLYLDQSSAAPVATVSPPPPAQVGPDPFAAIRTGGPRGSLLTDIMLSPRERGGKIDGYVMQPSANGEAFRAAGLQPGDVLVGVNGAKLSDGSGMRRLSQAIEASGQAQVEIERDGRTTTLTIANGR